MIFPEQIMIVEDEAITQRYLKDILVEKGITQVDCFDNAVDALSAMEKRTYQLILMDINIKGSIDGIQLSGKILDKYSIPIVFISAYSDDATLEDVLELSPFGFITKPFGSKEVLTSLSVAYKRFLMFEAKNMNNSNDRMIHIAKQYQYNLHTSTLFDDGDTVMLNAKQYILMAILVKNINNTVSFEELEIQIWPEEEISSSSLRTLVYNLRKLLPELPLQTHSKLGYSLNNQ
jgi:DNA-binding response OmpR family regulator